MGLEDVISKKKFSIGVVEGRKNNKLTKWLTESGYDVKRIRGPSFGKNKKQNRKIVNQYINIEENSGYDILVPDCTKEIAKLFEERARQKFTNPEFIYPYEDRIRLEEVINIVRARKTLHSEYDELFEDIQSLNGSIDSHINYDICLGLLQGDARYVNLSDVQLFLSNTFLQTTKLKPITLPEQKALNGICQRLDIAHNMIYGQIIKPNDYNVFDSLTVGWTGSMFESKQIYLVIQMHENHEVYLTQVNFDGNEIFFGDDNYQFTRSLNTKKLRGKNKCIFLYVDDKEHNNIDFDEKMKWAKFNYKIFRQNEKLKLN